MIVEFYVQLQAHRGYQDNVRRVELGKVSKSRDVKRLVDSLLVKIRLDVDPGLFEAVVPVASGEITAGDRPDVIPLTIVPPNPPTPAAVEGGN